MGLAFLFCARVQNFWRRVRVDGFVIWREAASIGLSPKAQQILKSLAKGTHTAEHLKHRATIIVLAAEGFGNQAIARETGWNRNTVKQWRNRWARGAPELTEPQNHKSWAVPRYLIFVLQDAPRPEDDFAQHIAAVVTRHPEDPHVFILDNLNTHQSEVLGCFVIDHDHLDISAEELGEKGQSGILWSQATRKRFLENTLHRVRFLDTPKHCSWLNQIECGFSILVRRLLNKWASFASIAALEERIRRFIEYYHEHLANPFRWTFDRKGTVYGRPLNLFMGSVVILRRFNAFAEHRSFGWKSLALALIKLCYGENVHGKLLKV